MGIWEVYVIIGSCIERPMMRQAITCIGDDYDDLNLCFGNWQIQ